MWLKILKSWVECRCAAASWLQSREQVVTQNLSYTLSDTEYQISEGNRIMVIDKLQNSIGPGEKNSWCLMFTSGIGGILASM